MVYPLFFVIYCICNHLVILSRKVNNGMNSNNKTEMHYHIEQLISSNFVKYNILSDLVKTNFNDSNASFLNIFIDLNSVLKYIYRLFDIFFDNQYVWTL